MAFTDRETVALRAVAEVMQTWGEALPDESPTGQQLALEAARLNALVGRKSTPPRARWRNRCGQRSRSIEGGSNGA